MTRVWDRLRPEVLRGPDRVYQSCGVWSCVASESLLGGCNNPTGTWFVVEAVPIEFGLAVATSFN